VDATRRPNTGLGHDEDSTGVPKYVENLQFLFQLVSIVAKPLERTL
jgi:hypothetical protein